LDFRLRDPYNAKLGGYCRFVSISLGAIASAAVVLWANATQAISLTRPQIDLFVLAGQSNMVGYGSNVAELPSDLAGRQQNVLWYNARDRWVTLAAPTEPLPFSNAKFPDSPAIAAGIGFGPEIFLGTRLQKALDRPVALVKYASNGANLTQDWQPTGLFYQPLIRRVNHSIAGLSARGYDVKVSGFFWLQGESDTRDLTWAQNYQTNLEDFIGRVRSDLNQPSLPFILGLIPLASDQLTARGYFPYADIVRSAQFAVSQTLPNVVAIETLDLPRSSDNLHLNSQGLIALGDRMADAWLSVPQPSPHLAWLAFGFLFLAIRRQS
jgi:Carbohydrate esterase, sialic acid-specific acetylesterase